MSKGENTRVKKACLKPMKQANPKKVALHQLLACIISDLDNNTSGGPNSIIRSKELLGYLDAAKLQE